MNIHINLLPGLGKGTKWLLSQDSILMGPGPMRISASKFDRVAEKSTIMVCQNL